MDGCAFLFQQFCHRRIWVFYKPLLGQANFTQEFFNSALNHFLNDFRRFTTFSRLR